MKRLKRILCRKRNGGFTLVEMIISIAILAILMVGMVFMITPIVRSFNDQNRDLVAENISTCIQNYISLSMRNATNVTIVGNTNEDSLKANPKVVQDLKDFCENNKTTDGKYAYILKCLSLRYDAADGRYYLYHDTIDTSSTTAIVNSATESTSVFSRCLYNGLYSSYAIEKAVDLDNAPARMNDTIRMTVRTYSGAGNTNLVFEGNGITEFREIGRDYKINPTNPKYKLMICSDDGIKSSPAVETDAIDTTTASGNLTDIYIYYTLYNMAAN